MHLQSFQNQSLQIYAVLKELIILNSILAKNQAEITIALSGGRSPIELFEAMSLIDINWSKINITLVDERIIDSQHVDSNEYLLRKHLFKNNAKNVKYTPIYAHLNNKVNFNIDIIILGMGEDGHIASIFSNAAEYQKAIDPTYKRPYIVVNPEIAPYPRISLSLQKIIDTKYVLLSINGAKKLQIINNIKNINNQNNSKKYDNYPIYHLFKAREDIKVYHYQ